MILIVLALAAVTVWLGEGGVTGAEVGVPLEGLGVPGGGEIMVPANETMISVPVIGNTSEELIFIPGDGRLITEGLGMMDVIANGSQCGAVTSSINLTNNILVNGTCFILNTSHVVINGMGLNITGNTSGYGFNTSANVQNVTIQNFLGIGKFEKGIQLGDRSGISRPLNLTVFNNSIYNNSYAIYFNYGDKDANISSNKIFQNYMGIVFGYSTYEDYSTNLWINFNNFTNNQIAWALNESYVNIYHANFNFTYNNIFNNSINIIFSDLQAEFNNNWWGFNDCSNISDNITGFRGVHQIDIDPYLNAAYPTGQPVACPSQYCGMVLREANVILTANLDNCTRKAVHMGWNNRSLNCNGYTITSAPNNYLGGIHVSDDSESGHSVNITNCKIVGMNNSVIIEYGSTRVNFINNSINYINTSSAGIVRVDSGNNFLANNNFSHNLATAFYITNNLNRFENNSVYNGTAGYNLKSSFNNFTNEKMINLSSGIIINNDLSSFHTNTFWNGIFANNRLDLNLYQTAGGNLTLINGSINKTKMNTDSGIKAYVRWYVDVNLTDNTGAPVTTTNITAYNSLDELEQINTTDGSGLGRLEMTEFYRNAETNYYVTPGRIVVIKTNFTQVNKSINLYDLTYIQINLTLFPIVCGSNITTDFTMGTNYQCAGNALTVLTDNIIINGNGFNLTGNGTNIGINITNRKNVSITNLRIQNYTFGLYLLNSNISNLTLLKLVNNSVGIYYENSYDNIFYDSNLGNNTNVSLYAINSDALNLTTLNISLANSTVKDFNDLNASGLSNIYYQWYVDVNVTNNRTALPNAQVKGRFNSSGALERTATNGDNGIARIRLTELKKNSTEIQYLTPHTLNLTYTLLNINYTNSTSINLTVTSNYKANLTLMLNCTIPTAGTIIVGSITFCPGTYDLNRDYSGDGAINIIYNNIITITCVDTILRSRLGNGIIFDITSNNAGVEIYNCTVRNAYSAIEVWSSKNIIIDGLNAETSSSTIVLYHSNSSTIRNSVLTVTPSNGVPSIWMRDSKYWSFKNNTISGYYGINIDGRSNNNTFSNNTFTNDIRMIYFDSFEPDYYDYAVNNTFYYNTFSGTGTYVKYRTTENYTNYFNTTLDGFGRGNTWGDYCGKGLDLNADGYADTDTAGAEDWPYSENISSRISDSTANNGGVIDYGPKITTCPAGDVFLGNSGGSSSASTAAPAAAAAAPAPGFSTYQKPAEKAPEDFSTLEEIKKHLKSEEIIVKRTSENTMQVAIKLENTGDQKMKLFPGLDQETEDPLYIVTKKTVGFEGSFFDKLAGIAYSRNTIAGKLLQAEIIGAEEIILNPGESIEKTLEIKEALIPPKQIKIKISSFGETVTEQEIKVEPKKVISGSALDIDTEQDLIDVYAIMVPEKSGNGETGNALTGAAIGTTKANSNLYYLEIKLTKKGSDKDAFVDWYGPYHTKPGQYFLFAQQFKYGQPFKGDYLLKTKIYRGEELVTEAEHEVRLE